MEALNEDTLLLQILQDEEVHNEYLKSHCVKDTDPYLLANSYKTPSKDSRGFVITETPIVHNTPASATPLQVIPGTSFTTCSSDNGLEFKVTPKLEKYLPYEASLHSQHLEPTPTFNQSKLHHSSCLTQYEEYDFLTAHHNGLSLSDQRLLVSDLKLNEVLDPYLKTALKVYKEVLESSVSISTFDSLDEMDKELLNWMNKHRILEKVKLQLR